MRLGSGYVPLLGEIGGESQGRRNVLGGQVRRVRRVRQVRDDLRHGVASNLSQGGNDDVEVQGVSVRSPEVTR